MRTEDLGSSVLRHPVSVVYMVITTKVPKMKQIRKKYIEIQIIYDTREYFMLSFIVNECLLCFASYNAGNFFLGLSVGV